MSTVNVSSLENTAHATEEFNAVVSQRQQRRRQRADSVELRDHVETADDVNDVIVEVDGDAIPMDPIGIGRRARISKAFVTAEERDDDVAFLDALLSMIDALNDASPDEWDQDYWDSLQDTQVRDAFQDLGQRSAGGNER